MDTVISVAERDPPVWDVSAARASVTVGQIRQQPDGSLVIVPNGQNLSGISNGPFRSLEEARRAIEHHTGGRSLVRDEQA